VLQSKTWSIARYVHPRPSCFRSLCETDSTVTVNLSCATSADYHSYEFLPATSIAFLVHFCYVTRQARARALIVVTVDLEEDWKIGRGQRQTTGRCLGLSEDLNFYQPFRSYCLRVAICGQLAFALLVYGCDMAFSIVPIAACSICRQFHGSWYLLLLCYSIAPLPIIVKNVCIFRHEYDTRVRTRTLSW
jgi:hypothetical protein